MHVNLLPASFIRRVIIRRLAWRWSATAAIIFLAAGGILAAQYSAVVKARQEHRVTALRSKKLHTIEAESQRLIQETKSLEETIAALKGARPEDRTLALLGIAATSSKQLNGKLHLKQLTTQIASTSLQVAAPPPPRGPAAGTAPPTPAPVQPVNDFVLDGVADDSAVIADFVEALKDTGVFGRVDLTGSTEGTTSTETNRHFRLDCKFQ